MKKVFAAAALAALASIPAQADEISWNDTINPIFEKHCIACHGSDAPEYADFKKDKAAWFKKGIGMRMETYSHLLSFVGWPNTGALMRRLDDGTGSIEGKTGNMYLHLGSDERERQANLAIFKQWVGNWNLKKWSEVSKSELNNLKVKY